MVNHCFLRVQGWQVIWLLLALAAAAFEIPQALAQPEQAGEPEQLCSNPVLSALVRHQVTASDTLDSIASQYSLLPTTVLGMNPRLSPGGPLPVGSELLLPPFNGIQVTVAPGQTWSAVAEAYGTRADILFEVNGCQAEVPQQVFIPGRNWLPGQAPESAESVEIAADDQILPGYPLPDEATILTSYGWQPHPSRDEMVFNNGIAFAALPGTEVRAVGDGVVAFASRQDEAGLVVINHAQGLQTRYANLDDISLTVGQPVTSGNAVGKVGGSDRAGPSFLYFEVRTNSAQGWVARNPGQYLPALELR
ncbi:M23 family metallopeptidase [Romeria aff. gracilis LEGE 07310]|uniref:M23 family metallopeptidase n=1 Tax=Vasconcelosia minhoensis LEGE 07310 TaxID=915328 RepID=A0A8J7AJW7_9CYAN|nr:M23 family metallopeptidase [Romeria gracilis]MBE9076665.1 M23 family metallopeptidase [Romeria aff. gracilis LEGE 07310]